MSGPLEGIRVLELTRVGPGAYCTMMLGDMGAEVLKLEAPPGGKLAGSGTSPPADRAKRLATSYTNRNKQSLTLDLKREEGRAVLHRLAADYDVLVEGFRPGVMGRLGGDYETLSAINPRLVYCSLSGYGQDGPYRNYPAHDLNYLSLAGVLNLLGEPDRRPTIPLNLVADYAGASMHGALGIMFALFARERSGKGQHVDVAYLDSTIALLAATPNVRDYFAEGVVPARGLGVFAGNHAYYGAYEAKDGKLITIACTEPWLWENFCDVVGKPHLKVCAMREGEFARPAGPAHAAARAELEPMFATKTREEWFELLSAADVCVGKVYDVAEVFEDPQVKHRGMALELEHPEAGRVIQAGIAIKLSDTPGEFRSFAPSIGADVEEVLRAAGYGAEEIRGLRERKVV